MGDNPNKNVWQNIAVLFTQVACVVKPIPTEAYLRYEMAKHNLERVYNVIPALTMVMLYTDEDIKLKSYVCKHFDELYVMSGNKIIVYVVEDAIKNSHYVSVSNWHIWGKQKLYELSKVFGVQEDRPYDKSGVYKIASLLGVPDDQLPCMVIFDDIEQSEKLIIPITSKDYTRFFRSFFTIIKKCLEDISFDANLTFSEKIAKYDIAYAQYGEKELYCYAALVETREEYRTALYHHLRSQLKEQMTDDIKHNHYKLGRYPVIIQSVSGNFIQEAKMGDTFNVSGGTFINKPKDTVIQDFQNTYITGADSQSAEINTELQKLIALILDSKDLPDASKEDAAQAVQGVAAQVKEEKVNKITVKGTLTALQEVLAKAADVAAPATAIIATVAKLLGLI